MVDASEFAKSLKSPFQLIVTGLILIFVVAVALGPMMVKNITKRSSRSSVSDAKMIEIALFSFAQDHSGKYLTGKSSTEIFQKLIDEKYLDDSTELCTQSPLVPGKTEATSDRLRPENVCWDLTVPMDDKSSDFLPVVFLTGYRINYMQGGTAVPLFSSSESGPPGIAVCYHGGSATWLKNDGQPDGIVMNFISSNFKPEGKNYVQLTPDGPLGP